MTKPQELDLDAVDVSLGKMAIRGVNIVVKPTRYAYDLVVTLDVRDVRDPDKVTKTTSVYRFDPAFVTESAVPREALANLVRSVVFDPLHHEVEEWLQIDGDRAFEPRHHHDDLRDRR